RTGIKRRVMCGIAGDSADDFIHILLSGAVPMIHEADGQALISAFFTALELRRLDQCQVVLDQLRSLSLSQPLYVPWCAYFEGILANERDHNVARAEQIFNDLLARDDLDAALRGRVLLALGVSYDYQGRWDDAIHTYESSLPVFIQL